MKIYLLWYSNFPDTELEEIYSTEELANKFRDEKQAIASAYTRYFVEEREIVRQQYSDRDEFPNNTYKRHHLACSNSLQTGPCSNCDRLYKEFS